MPAKKSENNLEKYEENIRHYGERIQTIKSFIAAVRRLPGEYIGGKGNDGWTGCVREIFQNAFDEVLRSDSPCNEISVIYDERDHSAIISDNGRGIPLGYIAKIYTEQHTSSNYEKKLYDYTSGIHGVGGGVANALSKEFDVWSYVLGEARHAHFEFGDIWDKGEAKVPCPKNRQGTTVKMVADQGLLGPITITCQDIFNLVLSVHPMLHVGDTIIFIGIDRYGKEVIKERLVNKNGIIDGLILKTQSPLIAPIIFSEDIGTMKADIAFTYDSSDLVSSEDISGFGNFTPAIGVHVNGFINGLCSFMRNYMNKIYLGNKSKITIVNSDIKTGLKAVVSGAHIDPVFKGQFKGILNNEDLGSFVEKLTYKSIEQWSKTNPNDLQKICKFIKDIAEIRTKSDDNKIKLSDNYAKSAINKNPQKYVPPSGKEHLELIIVEGDSAKGPAKTGRDPKKQGIFPIRGKLPNAFATAKATFLKNNEVASIIHLVSGGTYGKNFDMDKVKWEKVILMADADPDGAHIRTLLLRLFLLYMPEVIQAGKLYASIPPLYGIKTSRGDKYFTNTVDFAKYMQGLFMNKYTMTHIDGRKITPSIASEIFYRNIDYVKDLEVVSNTFAIDPFLLELVLYNYAPYVIIGRSDIIAGMAARSGVGKKVVKKNTQSKPKTEKKPKKVVNIDGTTELDYDTASDKTEDGLEVLLDGSVMNISYYISPMFSFKKFANTLKKQFKWLKVQAIKDTILIEGLVNSKYQYVFLNDKLINNCVDLIKMIQTNDELYYKVDGQVESLYTLMKKFESVTPNNLTRFKGLGEQTDKQLGESALRPDAPRTLVQYTMESAQREITNIRKIDTNKSVLYRDIRITRQDIE